MIYLLQNEYLFMNGFVIMKKNILPLIFLLAFSQNVYSGHGGNVRGSSFGHSSGGRSAVGHNSGGRSSGHLGGGAAVHSVANYATQAISSSVVQPQTNVMAVSGQQASTVLGQQVGTPMIAGASIQQGQMQQSNNVDRTNRQIARLIAKIDVLTKNKEVYLKWLRAFKEDHIDKLSGPTVNDNALMKFVSFAGTPNGENFDPGSDLVQLDGTVVINMTNSVANNTMINPLTNIQATVADLPALKKTVNDLYAFINCCTVFFGYLDNYVWQMNTVVKDLDLGDRRANVERGHRTAYNGHNWLRNLFYKSYGFLIETPAEKAERKRLQERGQ